MFKFFTTISSIVIIFGILLFASSFFVSVSFWYGIEIVKGGVFLFVIGMFVQLMHINSLSKGKLPQ